MTQSPYLLVIGPGTGDADFHSRLAQATALDCHTGWQGAALFIEDSGLIAAQRPGRIYLGRIFGESKALTPAQLHDRSRLWSAPDPSLALGEDLWGSWLSISITADGHVTLLRAPFGRLGCYRLRGRDGRHYVSNDVATLLRASGEAPRLDPAALARFLAWPQIRSSDTCLADVRELPPGAALRIAPDKVVQSQEWTPWRFAEPARAIRQMDEAARALHETILMVTRALARDETRIVLALSGGLDSSIIAAALAAAGAPVTAINLVTEDTRGDEQSYARCVADHLGLDLRMAPERPDLVDPWTSDAAHLPRPTSRAYTQSADRQQQRLAENLNASAYFSGGGGDQIFAFTHSSTPLLDYLAMEGWNAGAWEVARDIARLTATGLPALALTALRRAARRDNRYHWRADMRGLTLDAQTLAAIPPHHPWGDPPASILPGKAMHVAWAQHIENYLEGYGRETTRPIHWPLMTQPVVELCLRIPSWMWGTGGRNRAVARQAFSADLPRTILERAGKGTPESVVTGIFERHRAAIGEHIGAGVLVELGLADRQALDRLMRDGTRNPAEYNRVMAWLDVETWARHWQGWALSQSLPRSHPFSHQSDQRPRHLP